MLDILFGSSIGILSLVTVVGAIAVVVVWFAYFMMKQSPNNED